MIKILYPEFLSSTDNLVAGWPDTPVGYRFANEVKVGQELAVYITEPIKKVVGIVKVTGNYTHDPNSRWPYQTPVEWVVGPKVGLTLQDVRIDVIPGRGDTGYRVGQARVAQIKRQLSDLPNLM